VRQTEEVIAQIGLEAVKSPLGERGRPPVEERGVTDTGWIVLKGNTALCLYLLQLIQRLEAAIGDSLVGERPETLTGLQLR
jgi:hypothetical protein